MQIRFAIALVTAMVLAGPTSADVLPLTTLLFESEPTVDLVDADFAGVPNGFIRPNFSDAPDVATSEATITGFGTSAGLVNAIAGPVDATNIVTFPTGLEPPAGDLIRNVYGFQGAEPTGISSILGTNVGAGLDNAGATGDTSNPIQPFEVFFGRSIVGAPGAANDFFLIDIIGDDAVDLRPIDANGDLIGDFVLRLASGPGPNNFGNSDLGDFGLTGFDMALFLENGANIGLPEETVIDDVPLAGVAFDIEDFDGTGTLNSLAGFQITPLDLDPSVSSAEGSIDLIAIGYNVAAVPEPTSAAMLLVGLGGLRFALTRRGRSEARNRSSLLLPLPTKPVLPDVDSGDRIAGPWSRSGATTRSVLLGSSLSDGDGSDTDAGRDRSEGRGPRTSQLEDGDRDAGRQQDQRPKEVAVNRR